MDTQYARIQDGTPVEYPLLERAIRARFPLTSFSTPFRAPDGYVEVIPTDKPDFDHVLQVAVHAPPVSVDGVWEQRWNIVDKYREYQTTVDGRPTAPGRLPTSDEELITVTKEEQEARALEEYKTSVASQVRSTRNQLLTDSDWTQFNDSPLSDQLKLEWAQYRQALRDVTSQDGFPLNVTFPTPPQ